MGNLSETKKNHTTPQQPETDVRGRTHNSQNSAFEGKDPEDISAVDQQEGNMEHGETGGYREPEQKQP